MVSSIIRCLARLPQWSHLRLAAAGRPFMARILSATDRAFQTLGSPIDKLLSMLEVVNDRSRDIANFFRALQQNSSLF